VTRIGILGGGANARVLPDGTLEPERTGWKLTWWIGADDRWRVPLRETTVRQSLVEDVPVVRTALRVPGGDAVVRAYAVPDADGTIALDIANESAAPFVVALVVQQARRVALVDELVRVDERPGIMLARAPSRWAVAVARSTDVEVCGGTAREGPFPPTRDRAARIEAAFLLPVPHRVSVRAAIDPKSRQPVDPRSLPSPDDVVRGWHAQLDRGTTVELPDERLTGAVRAARSQLLLAASDGRPSGDVVAALEDWGNDSEAASAWRSLSGRERRRAGHRRGPPSARTLDELVDAANVPGRIDAVGPELLLAVRSLLVAETGAGEITLLHELPESWRGQPIEVHDAPTRAGTVSFAVRWHGERPALLWTAPPGVRLRAPGLDPEWSSDETNGEALLAGSTA
jgi:hypothetical protein